MRIVFMGTPEIAAHCLVELLESGHNVVGVYTRPDKPVGRKQLLTPPPVKVRAAENQIPVYQPPTLRSADAAAQLAALQPDLVVVVAYGMILPPDVLAVPTHGCINLHVSLLPKYRGAAPIQWAVINGEKETGVTVMQIDAGLDTGPILTQQRVDISPNATSGEMFDLVAGIGARLLADTVSAIGKGGVSPAPQTGESTHAPQLTKNHAVIDFALPALKLHNLIRGCNPWPLAWFMHEGKRVKVLRAKQADLCGKPGEVLALNPLTISCGEASIILEHVVPEGSRAMTGAEWAAGRRFKVTNVLLPE